MKIVNDPKKMASAIKKERVGGKSIGFVPTLGFLHEGHEALMRKARLENDVLAVSRFVNPLQFRAKAFKLYPRDFERDAAICRRNGVDYLFSPGVEDMYPDGFDSFVEVENLTGRLEGAKIRWHYRGVTTVVAKLFNIVSPDKAYFGKKDAHQVAILKRMVADLNFQVKIVPVSTRRDKDGLALSSRNSLLSDEERIAAKVIPDSINAIAAKIKLGRDSRRQLAVLLKRLIENEPLAKVDYCAIVDADSLREDVLGDSTMIYAAVFIGGKRLTDNLVIPNPKPHAR